MFRSWFRASEPLRGVRTIHSSRGRLRVHLPYWSGKDGAAITARLRRLPGVLDVQTNSLTGNVLILFHPRITNADLLIGELQTLPQAIAPPPLPPIEAPTPVPVSASPDYYVTGVRRVIYIGLGWASVGMAVVGFIVPGIPGAPFVVLAGYFFIRSSPPAHQWLRQSQWFGPILRDWEEHRAIRRSIRNAAVGLIVFAAVVMPLFGLPVPVLVSIWVMQLVGATIVLRLRVIDRPTPAIAFVP